MTSSGLPTNERDVDVLEFVNGLRAKHRLGEPLDAMPCGDRSGRSCPIARALRVGDGPFRYVGQTAVTLQDSDDTIRMPPAVISWVRRFDAGAIPGLLAS